MKTEKPMVLSLLSCFISLSEICQHLWKLFWYFRLVFFLSNKVIPLCAFLKQLLWKGTFFSVFQIVHRFLFLLFL